MDVLFCTCMKSHKSLAVYGYWLLAKTNEWIRHKSRCVTAKPKLFRTCTTTSNPQLQIRLLFTLWTAAGGSAAGSGFSLASSSSTRQLRCRSAPLCRSRFYSFSRSYFSRPSRHIHWSHVMFMFILRSWKWVTTTFVYSTFDNTFVLFWFWSDSDISNWTTLRFMLLSNQHLLHHLRQLCMRKLLH